MATELEEMAIEQLKWLLEDPSKRLVVQRMKNDELTFSEKIDFQSVDVKESFVQVLASKHTDMMINIGAKGDSTCGTTLVVIFEK